MLKLTRNIGEKVLLNTDCIVTVANVNRKKKTVRLKVSSKHYSCDVWLGEGAVCDETLIPSPTCTVRVLEVFNRQARLGFIADDDVKILRSEIPDRDLQQPEESVNED